MGRLTLSVALSQRLVPAVNQKEVDLSTCPSCCLLTGCHVTGSFILILYERFESLFVSQPSRQRAVNLRKANILNMVLVSFPVAVCEKVS